MARLARRVPLFSTLRRGVEFISRPNALDSHERHRRSIASIILTLFLEAHPFSRSPTITGAGSLLLSLDLDSPFSFRDVEKHPSTSRRRVLRRGHAVAKIHRRRYTHGYLLYVEEVAGVVLWKFTKEEEIDQN